jgi:hypothetical protein
MKDLCSLVRKIVDKVSFCEKWLFVLEDDGEKVEEALESVHIHVWGHELREVFKHTFIDVSDGLLEEALSKFELFLEDFVIIVVLPQRGSMLGHRSLRSSKWVLILHLVNHKLFFLRHLRLRLSLDNHRGRCRSWNYLSFILVGRSLLCFHRHVLKDSAHIIVSWGVNLVSRVNLSCSIDGAVEGFSLLKHSLSPVDLVLNLIHLLRVKWREHVDNLCVLDLSLLSVPMVSYNVIDLRQKVRIHLLRQNCRVHLHFCLCSCVYEICFQLACMYIMAFLHLILNMMSDV